MSTSEIRGRRRAGFCRFLCNILQISTLILDKFHRYHTLVPEITREEGDAMADGHLTIEGEIEAASSTVQVRNYDQPAEELDTTTAWPSYTLIRALGPVSYSANTGAGRFLGFGDVFFIPAEIPLKYQGIGGPYRHITCRLDAPMFERMT